VLLENNSYVTYTVTDAMGCVASDSAQIIFPTFIDNPELISPLCYGDTNGQVLSNINGGFGDLTYSWSVGTADTFIDQLAEGVYTLDVTDAYGCSDQFTYTLAQPDLLVVTGNATDITCVGCSSEITISAVGGTPPYNGIGVFNQTAQGVYPYSVVDANGCVSTVEVTVNDISNISEISGVDLTIYPNPFRDEFSVDLDLSLLQEIRIFDSQGRDVHFKIFPYDGKFNVLVDGLSPGVYYLEILLSNSSRALARMVSL